MTHVPFLPGWQGFVANLAPVMVLAWIVQSVQNARRKGKEVLFPCAETVSIVFTFVRNLFLCAALEFLGVAGVKGDISKITLHPMNYWSAYVIVIISFVLYVVNIVNAGAGLYRTPEARSLSPTSRMIIGLGTVLMLSWISVVIVDATVNIDFAKFGIH